MIAFKTCKYSMIALLFLIPFYMGKAQAVNTVSKTPVFSLNTNLLHDASTLFLGLSPSMNLGLEFKTGNHVTIKLPVTYNPWEGKDYKKFKFVLVQPELRWWFCEPFYGSFFGIHAHGAIYNVGAVGTNYMKDYRFQGYLYGAGLSYGHQFYLAPRWNLEFSIGGGYAYLNFKQYECEHCGRELKNPEEYKSPRNYWGLTQASFTLIYIIK